MGASKETMFLGCKWGESYTKFGQDI